MKLRELGPDLSSQLRQLYLGLGVEMPTRELDQTIEEEMLEVFKLHVRRETGKALGLPIPMEIGEDEDSEEA